MPNLFIVRGIPGSGKTTYATTVLSHALHFEADQFFVRADGQYKYDIALIGEAHDWCYGNVVRQLLLGNAVVVSNTFTALWELDRYVTIPSIVPDVVVSVIEMRTEYQSIHGIPPEKLQKMKDRWEEIPEVWINGRFSVTRVT